MKKLRIFNAKWTSMSAGPSPDGNRRTEIFLAGCKKAADGDPCPGCFNAELWRSEVFNAEVTPVECYKQIVKYAPNKHVTFVGGEPLDQVEPLSKLCYLLKTAGYKIIVITHFLGKDLIEQAKDNIDIRSLLENIDGLIDGEYDRTQRIWDDSKAGDGLHDVIGSANQRIYDFKRYREGLTSSPKSVAAGDIDTWKIDNDGNFLVSYNKKKEAAA